MRNQIGTIVLCVASLAVSANATPVANGLDPLISDVLTVYTPAGGILNQVTALEANEVANELYAITSENLCDPQYVIKEPGTNIGIGTGYALLESENGAVSDVYGVWDLDHDGNPHFGFLSDLETSLGQPYPLPINIIGRFVEVPGQKYDMTQFLAIEYRNAGYTASFQSDGDVPEPATMSLLALGAAALLKRRSRR